MPTANPKSLINARSLEELLNLATPQGLRRFIGIAECQAAWQERHWPEDDKELRQAVIDAIHGGHRQALQAADHEAARIKRLATSSGAQVLITVAEQFHDNEMLFEFIQQPGGQIGRAIWMRAHSAASYRLFQLAESVLATGEIRIGHRLYDAYEVPCEVAPPFIWSTQIKEALEAELMKAMRLDDQPDIVHLEMFDESRSGQAGLMHCLVIRFAGPALCAARIRPAGRESFAYLPVHEATLIYAPQRKLVEVFAHNLALRAPMANVLARHGFTSPLSSRPLNRARFDLAAFTRPLKHVRPTLEVGKVERLYLLEAKALLGHASDTVKIAIGSGAELHDIIAERWGAHPFMAPEMLLRVTLVADVVFNGEVNETPLSITVAKPGRCSLQGERDPRIRMAGEQLLEHLGVVRRLPHDDPPASPDFLHGGCRLMELADSPVDGFALHEMGIDIELFANEGILLEAGRISERRIECAPGQAFTVKLDRCADGIHVRYADPLSGAEVLQPAHLARKWSVNTKWLREELLSALGTQLCGVRMAHTEATPAYMGEITIEGQQVAVYFAPRMGHEQTYRVVDGYLRLHTRAVPGIVLTSATQPFPFAGTNVVIPIEDVLSRGDGPPCIDHDALAAAYRFGKLAARGGARVDLQLSPDKLSGVLSIPGKAPWAVTGKMKIVVLERLMQAHIAGPAHVVTKTLLAGTHCDSLDGLFGNESRWRDYIEKVDGTRAWRLFTEPPAAELTHGARDAQNAPSLID